VFAAMVANAAAIIAIGVQVVIFIATPGSIAKAARDVSASGHIPLAHAEHLAMIAVVIIVSYWSVLLVALVVFSWSAFHARNWARAWLVPTALLAMIELIAVKPLPVVIAVASVAAAVLLYLPSSSAYFANTRRHSRTG
jgi:hypothetical protein